VPRACVLGSLRSRIPLSKSIASKYPAYLKHHAQCFIKTYGCQMNERDSEAVAAQLLAKGYTLAPSEAAADVIC